MGLTKDYDILQVQQVVFESAPVPASAPLRHRRQRRHGTVPPLPRCVACSNGILGGFNAGSSTPQLRRHRNGRRHSLRQLLRPIPATPFPTGSKVMIQLVDAINSETSKAGSTFVAVLDEPLLVNGIEVAPRGADIRGRITTANDAGRIAGSAELGLELTQIYINGIPYALSTSEYSEAGESRTGQTVQRAGIGAGVGAIIGAIAGGGKGAAIGAGVGAGAGTASQVLTKARN